MIPIVLRPAPAILLLISLTLTMLAPARAQTSPLPPLQTQGDVTFLSGGIGSDETAAIKAASKDYTLTVQFSTTTGAFLASVPVKITDAGGRVVLDTVAEGPYLLVNLAPGRYTVDAALDGISRGTEVTIRAGSPQKRSLIWPPRKSDPEPIMVPSTPGANTIVTTVPSMSTTATITPAGEVIVMPPEAAMTATVPTPSSALSARVTASGIPYVTGGIGSDESEAIKAQFSRYAMALTFATRMEGHHAFLALVPVQIRDASGATLLDVTTGGPYLLVDVPPGRYEVVATHDGREQRAAVEVGPGRRAERTFVWTTP